MQGYIQYMCFYAPQKEKIGELFKIHGDITKGFLNHLLCIC